MKPKYPQILSWLTKKSGIAPARAEALWHEAIRHATRKSAVVESPEYWKLALDHVTARIAAEAQELRAKPFGFGPLLRLPGQIWLHGLTVQNAWMNIAANSAQYWRRAC